MEPMATILETARMRLREFTESDLATLATMKVGRRPPLPTEDAADAGGPAEVGSLEHP
jgi:hypothetical protein